MTNEQNKQQEDASKQQKAGQKDGQREQAEQAPAKEQGNR
jgi:hypothetical protein